MEDRGDLYLDRYEGWYSVRDEAFYDEERADRRRGRREAVAAGHAGRMDGRGELVLPPVANISSRCSTIIAANPDFIRPESRRNEVLRFVEGGLKDLSVSRTSFDWGVPVPGSADHVMYVWLDALTNYITGVGYPDETASCARATGRPNVHLIGKDVVRFHAVYWPAFLMSRRNCAAASRSTATASCSAAARRCRRASAMSSTRWRWPSASGSTRCAISCCAKSRFGQDGSYSAEAIVSARQCRAGEQLRQSRPAQLCR